jgi:hypothetical protein
VEDQVGSAEDGRLEADTGMPEQRP